MTSMLEKLPRSCAFLHGCLVDTALNTFYAVNRGWNRILQPVMPLSFSAERAGVPSSGQQSSGFPARFVIAAAVLVTPLLAGCELRQKMFDQPSKRPYQESEFFEDGMSARPMVEGAVPRGHLEEDDHLYRGRVDDEFAESYPFPVNREVIIRGKERYNIYCSVCHDHAGYGNGMVVQRGFQKPESLHTDRLVESPEGYYFEVISRGFGRMPGYSYQLSAEDRWAIIAYIRALQLSQRATLDDVPEDIRENLQAGSL